MGAMKGIPCKNPSNSRTFNAPCSGALTWVLTTTDKAILRREKNNGKNDKDYQPFSLYYITNRDFCWSLDFFIMAHCKMNLQ